MSAQPAANIKTGNRLVVEIEMWSHGAATAASVTDSAGNTVKPTTQASMGIAVLEYSGLSSAPGTGVVDQIASATGTSGGAAQSVASGPTAPLASNNTLVLGLYADSGFGVSVSPDAAFTQRVNTTPSDISDLLIQERLADTGQQPNATARTGPNTTWLMATIALEPASGGGAPQTASASRLSASRASAPQASASQASPTRASAAQASASRLWLTGAPAAAAPPQGARTPRTSVHPRKRAPSEGLICWIPSPAKQL